jgi:hypothetical protein
MAEIMTLESETSRRLPPIIPVVEEDAAIESARERRARSAGARLPLS